MLGTGAVVPGIRANRCLGVKHNSNFLRCGMETDISFISSNIFSLATSSTVVGAATSCAFPFWEGSMSTRRRLSDDEVDG